MQPVAHRLRCLRPYAMLALLCLLLDLPGIAAIPPLDRDEARFAQATRQMLETGDFLRIRFQDEERNKKPAGIYWLQAAVVGLFSTPAAVAIWPYRLPSLLGATAGVLAIFEFGAALFRGRPAAGPTAVIGGVLLCSALSVVAEAHIAKTDAALLFTVIAGQGALGLIYARSRAGENVPSRLPLVFWAAEIAAIFLKGPIGPGLAAITAGALTIADRETRWLRQLRPVAGIGASVMTIAPWLIAIEYATSGHFLADAAGGDLLAKLTAARELHGAPPGSYLLLSPVILWPGSLLLVPAIVRAWHRRSVPAERFLLAWLAPGWVLLELIPTKLPHYVLPLLPALALLAAAALAEGARLPPGTWARRLDWLVTVLWIAVTLTLAASLIVLPLRLGEHIVIAGAFGVAALLGLSAALLCCPRGPRLTTGFLAALSFVFVIAAASVLPGLDQLWLSRAAAALVARHPPAGGSPLVAVGYAEPSLVFLLGTGLHLTSPAAAAAALARGGEALVANGARAAFREAIERNGLSAMVQGSARGLDYSNGQRIVLTLYVVSGPPQ